MDECDDLAALARGERGPVRLYRRVVSAAASLLIVAVSALLVFQSGPMSATEYETKVGGRETVMLKDGSVITLNTDTRLSVALSGTERRILLEKGEAFFDVAKDKTRPFLVVVGKDVVRAVGTAFNVRRRADTTQVTVTEGIVEVNGATLSTLLHVGADLTINPAGIQTVELAPAEVESTVSWRTGMIHFSNKRLGAVVEELQYYAEKEIIVTNDQVSNLIVGGSFDTSNASSFLKGLEAIFPVKVIERDTVIILGYAQNTTP